MTEEPERELTPEEDARIRSLLASARADETVPDDVAARLDSVLAELNESRTSAPRRRRNTGRWLLGAAAASVAAFAVFAAFHLPGSTPSTSGTASAGTASTGATPGDTASAPRAEAAAPAALPRLSSATFRRDVTQLLASPGNRYRLSGSPVPATGPSSGSLSDGPEQPSDGVRGPACQAPVADAGSVQSSTVLLDGQPALLEVFAVSNGSRVVRVISCDGAQTLASARIPAP